MSVYLDTSVLVSMFVEDAHTPRVWRLAESKADFVASAWALAEFSSALGLQVRIGRLTPEERTGREQQLDLWTAGRPDPVLPLAEDFAAARALVRQASVPPLRAPDALHLALCRRLDLTLASFDQDLEAAARALGVATADV